MTNTKISDLPLGDYKDTLLIPTADGNTNTAIQASVLRGPGGGGTGPTGPTGPSGTGASTLSEITDATDVIGPPFALAGFDAGAFPAAVVLPVPSSVVSYDNTGAVGTTTLNALRQQLGLPAASPNTFSGYDSGPSPVAMTRSQALAALGLSNEVMTATISTVVNGTFLLCVRSWGTFLVSSLDASTATGTFTVAIKVGSVTVGGLGSVSVNTSLLNTPAVGPNSVALGDVISMTISGATGSPTSGLISLNLQRV